MSDLRIVALDLSLVSTGGAAYAAGEIGTWIVRSKLTGPARLAQVRDVVMPDAERASLVALEGYSYASVNSQAHSLGELGGVIRVALWEAEIPYVVVSPKEIKKYATGKGNASKRDVFGAAVHRFGHEFATDDEADARWLLDMALCHYGLPHVPMPTLNRAVLDKIQWPTLTLEVVA